MEAYYTALSALVNLKISTIRDCKENYEAQRLYKKKSLKIKTIANDCDE